MQTVPEQEINGRIGGLRKGLAALELAGALITARTDRYYFAGTTQEGFLWVPSTGGGDPVLWILRDVDRARRETPLEVKPIAGWKELWGEAKAAAAERVGLAADVVTLTDLERLGLSRGDAVTDISPLILRLRGVKSPWEIARMEDAGRVAAAVFEHAIEILRPGMTEAELAGLLFARAMALGHEGSLRTRGAFEAYSWHVLSGPNTALPGAVDTPMSGEGFSPSFPSGAGHRRIGRGEPVLVDFGVCVKGYQTDQTRTLCLGPPPQWLRDGHDAIVAVQEELLSRLRPGESCGAAFAAGVEKARALSLDGYLGPPGRTCRFVGHGIGLETVEPPIVADGSGTVVEAGMTVALEPKAVIGSRGGVGVEDTVLAGKGSARPLAPVPLELLVV